MNMIWWPLVRDAGRLFFLRNQPVPEVGQRLRRRGVDSGWRLQRIDLEQLPVTSEHAALVSVREAWVRLSRASRDAETLAALLLVLCSSSSSGARCASPLPDLRGTDLRPWLSDAVAIALLLRSLSPFMPRALGLLAAHRSLPLEQLSVLPNGFAGADLFMLARCREYASSIDADAATRLSRELLALAPKGRAWSDASAAATAIESLHLDQIDDGLGLAARVWTLSGSGWLREIGMIEREYRATALRLLIATDAAANEPPLDVRRVFKTLEHVGNRERRGKDLRWIIKGLQRGASVSSLAGALRVATTCTAGDVSKLDEAPRTTWAMQSHFFVWLSTRVSDYCVKRAWRACAHVPGLAGAMVPVRSLSWLFSWTAGSLIKSLIRLAERKPKHPVLPTSELKRLSEIIIATVRRLDRWKASDWVDALDKFFTESGPLSGSGCDEAISLTNRLERLVDSGAPHVAIVLRAMIDVMGEGIFELVAKLPDEWFKRIAESAATWVRRGRVCDGIDRLRRREFEMLWDACRLFPARWFNLMQEIACVPKGGVSRVFASAAEHPLFACRWRFDTPRRALVLIDCVREERCRTNPVSKRLREHVGGGRLLPRHLLEHDLAALGRGWIEAQVHLVEELVQREVWRAFPGLDHDDGITEHSLKLALTIDDNKRPLRRLIRCCARGDHDWLARHPLNQQWQRLLGEALASRWRDGIASARVLPNLGEVILAPEDNPQEILRMGSAVGSCLSVGSCNSYSAAANALDANKRVVYARTRQGKVVGRQLLAISDQMRLVCFSPYPTSLREPLLEFFGDYDEVLASHLGLPLHRTGDYTIKALVAKEWYDDGLWDRFARSA
jgi:hypothetical protein